ncbi:L-lactate permease [Natronobacterium texcoconense]|uniref:Lactate permease n=1 Tax=Natronobacterium texcoconense TaxID=1095778 RepID=A0A1H1AH81_NATTX|nr:L-lactate permease [Natronobacterium texcoconense]SDQ39103.1 lactate permease [Natronobacterium texcoconense]
MASVVELAAAALPLVLTAVLIVGLLWPATRAMPLAWIAALLVGYLVWANPVDFLVGASIVGVMTALEILWIVFGALVLLYTLMQAGAFDRINRGFAAVSDDRRVQIVLLAFFLATFIEGAAGFGTPAAVVAPLLLALGFPALAAVIAALIGHIIAVTYGAVGTPIIVGIETPLSDYEGVITGESGMTVTEYSMEVAAWAATYHSLVGFVMPLFAVGMVVYFFSEERSIKPALEVVPLCLFAGIAFVIPYWTSAWFLTAEFPALIGSMVGGAVTVAALRAGYFLPESEWEFPPREEWPRHWVGTIEPGSDGEINAHGTGDRSSMSLVRAWSPYVFLVVLLVITRVSDQISEFLVEGLLIPIETNLGEFTVGFVLAWDEILGYEALEAGIEWVNVPGFWLLVSALVAIPIFGMSGQQVKAAWREAGEKIVSPFIALVFVIAMVQVMINAGSYPGATLEESMIEVLAIATADVTGAAYPTIAALIGGLGAAMTGSNTVSNITFSGFQFTAAQELGLPTQIIVGAQAVGGAMGNLVAIHNIVAALATVGLVGQEGRVIRLNLIPLAYYAIGVGIVATIFSYVAFTGVF